MSTRYECAVDFDAIDAIDIHTHVEIDGCGHRSLDDELMAASEKYFRSGEERTPGIESIAEHYRQRNMAAVVFTVDAHSASGHSPNSVEEIAERAAEFNDVLIPFGSVDPLQGKAAVKRVHRLVDEFGVRGFKFHPSMQVSNPTTAGTIRSTRRSPKPACPHCSTPGRPESAPDSPAGTASSCAIPIRCCSTMSPPTSPTSPS